MVGVLEHELPNYVSDLCVALKDSDAYPVVKWKRVTSQVNSYQQLDLLQPPEEEPEEGEEIIGSEEEPDPSKTKAKQVRPDLRKQKPPEDRKRESKKHKEKEKEKPKRKAGDHVIALSKPSQSLFVQKYVHQICTRWPLAVEP